MKTNAALINHANDFLMSGGSPARMLARGLMKTGKLNTNGLRTNDVLRKDEWKLLDDVLVDVGRDRLIGVADLRAAGLVENLGGLGITLSQYEKLSDMSAADIDFAGVTDGEKDSVTFTLVSVPVPIIHKGFDLNIRRLEASRGASAVGQGIDRTQVEVCTLKVTEGIEDLLFNGTIPGTGGALTGNTILGYTTATNRNTVSGSDWGTVTNVTPNVISAIGAAESDGYYGPWNLYVATNQFGQLREFYTDGSGNNNFDRIMRLTGMGAVRPGDRLTDGTAVLVTMRRSTVDVAVGQDLTVVEWESKGGLMLHFKVISAMVGRVKDDANSGSGITTISGI